MFHSRYRRCFIYRNTLAGSRLRWSAFTPFGSVAADTLDGIRRLIREKLA